MDPSSLAVLPVLALVDSTSAGTLLVPVWLLLAPRVRPRAVVGYLAVVAVAYAVLGALLLAGAEAITAAVEGVDAAGRPEAVLVAQLGLGLALLAWALLPDRWRRRRPAVGSAGERGGDAAPGRLARWRDRAASGTAPGALLALAAIAVLLEAATMLPYLGAVALLAASGLTTGPALLVIAGYCLVMVAPALVLVALRVLAARRVEPALVRLDRWSRRAGGEAVLWVAGIAGFLLARDAVAGLGWL